MTPIEAYGAALDATERVECETLTGLVGANGGAGGGGPDDTRVLVRLIADFRDAHPAEVRRWSTRKGAHKQCWFASRLFARFLHDAGVRYEFRRFTYGHGGVHFAVVVDGLVVDWAARQFRREWDVPRVVPLALFHKDFRDDVDVDCCAGCGIENHRLPPALWPIPRCPGPQMETERIYQRLLGLREALHGG